MYNILLVSDASSPEENIIKLLQQIPKINVIEKNADFDELFFHMKKEMIDVIFVNLGTENGERLQIVEEIINRYPKIKVVLISENRGFAVKAFEIGVYDYMLNPVKKERIIKTFNRLFFDRYKDKNNAIKYIEGNIDILIRKKVETIHWRTKKSKELFLYLIEHKGVAVKKDVLLEIFWPNATREKAFNSLYNSISILRHTLKREFPGIEISNINDNYRLEMTKNILIF